MDVYYNYFQQYTCMSLICTIKSTFEIPTNIPIRKIVKNLRTNRVCSVLIILIVTQIVDPLICLNVY